MRRTFRLLWGVVVRPRSGLREIAEQRPVAGALLLLLAFTLIGGLTASFRQPDRDLFSSLLLASLTTFVFYPLLAGMIFIAGKLVRARASYATVFCVLTFALAPWFVSSLLHAGQPHSLPYITVGLMSMACCVWTCVLFCLGLRNGLGLPRWKVTAIALPVALIYGGILAGVSVPSGRVARAAGREIDGPASDGNFESVTRWRRIEGNEVVVYCPPGKSEAETTLAVQGSEAMVERICRLLNVDRPPFKVGVYLFPHGDLYERYVLEKGQPYGTSYAYSRSVAMLDDSWTKNRTNVAHELGHVIIDFRLTSHAPGLVEEGFATYVEEETTGAPDGTSRAPVSPLPLRKLARSDTFYDWDQAERCSNAYGYYAHYAHAGGFVRFLIERYGMERFKDLYHAIDEDDSGDESECVARSMEKVYRVSLESLETSWRRSCRAKPPVGG